VPRSCLQNQVAHVPFRCRQIPHRSPPGSAGSGATAPARRRAARRARRAGCASPARRAPAGSRPGGRRCAPRPSCGPRPCWGRRPRGPGRRGSWAQALSTGHRGARRTVPIAPIAPAASAHHRLAPRTLELPRLAVRHRWGVRGLDRPTRQRDPRCGSPLNRAPLAVDQEVRDLTPGLHPWRSGHPMASRGLQAPSRRGEPVAAVRQLVGLDVARGTLVTRSMRAVLGEMISTATAGGPSIFRSVTNGARLGST
jgi:hypothetical protein